nr:cysteine-rich protein 2-binding protein [Onthophagus taurus]
MDQSVANNRCKYCKEELTLYQECLTCINCNEGTHTKCSKKGSVPGGLSGDVFFKYTCSECSSTSTEVFVRDKMPWVQVITLILHHMQTRTPGLARKGYFHWKTHIATFITKYWDVLFSKDFKRKKKWMGTVAGALSHNSPLIFSSGTSAVNDQGWWTLTYPQLLPKIIVDINSEFISKKLKYKENKVLIYSDVNLFEEIAVEKGIKREFLETVNNSEISKMVFVKESIPDSSSKKIRSEIEKINEASPKKYIKLDNHIDQVNKKSDLIMDKNKLYKKPGNFLDPFIHYNTSLKSISHFIGAKLSVKLTGTIREELILSPYSGLYLKPYILRDTESFPTWLQLMAEIQLKGNEKNENFILQPRYPIDYTYVQPSHIPAINSLCNQFFWEGIDLTESLQYPDFSCVALYKKLIVAFGFIVPNVNVNENYLSFIFTRPGWRNAGLGRFIIYHLIQTSLGKDITLHVSITNAALLLYQKFGFKVENVELGFYDKYLRRDTTESKHAFFCRLER